MRLAHLRTAQLLLLGFVVYPDRAGAQGLASAAHRTVTDSCLPPSEFQLGGIDLHSDALAAVSTLKPPIRKSASTGEDDGGRYEIQRYDSPPLSIAIVRGMIDRLSTRYPTTSTPSGLKPGMSFKAIQDVLAPKGVSLRQFADTIDVGVCSGTEGIVLEDYLTLIFDRQRRLRVL